MKFKFLVLPKKINDWLGKWQYLVNLVTWLVGIIVAILACILPIICNSVDCLALFRSQANDEVIIYNLYLATLNGQTRRITNVSGNDPRWQRDSHTIIFSGSIESSSLRNIMRYDPLDQSTEIFISNNDRENLFEPASLQPDSQIALVKLCPESGVLGVFLYIDEAISSDPLTSCSTESRTPDWSPDGRYIAFSSNVGGNQTLQLYDTQSRTLNNIPGLLEDASYPRWDPDGGSLVFSMRSDQGDFDLYVWQQGQDITRLILDQDGTDEISPVWSPDGSEIMYISRPIGNEEEGIINRINLETGVITQVISVASSYTSIDWKWSP
jgi:Tol biopolymer transport system component